MLGTSEQIAKISKLVSQKLGTHQFPSPNGLGFQVKKLVLINLKVGKKKFSYPCLGFYHQNHPMSEKPEKPQGVFFSILKTFLINKTNKI